MNSVLINLNKVSISSIFRYFIHRIKGKFYEHKFTKIKKGLRISGKYPKIVCEGKIIAGRDLSLRSITQSIELFAGKGAELIIGGGCS